MSLIPSFESELSLDEISSQQWADLMGLDLEEFADWYGDAIDFYDEDEIHSRPFAYGRLVADWRGGARYSLEAIMQRKPHPFLYKKAQSYLLKAEAIELVAACEGFDLAAERYPHEEKNMAKIAAILANHDAIAAKLSACAALPDSEADA
ncbi:hypothetical protein [Citrobacter gillenii]|uniref:hypothetical protein n=1 Tax=Citrobacter gillenii TaxID=67828 RepID=UPI0039874548